MKFLNLHEYLISISEIETIYSAVSAPVNRAFRQQKEKGCILDLTHGKKVISYIVLKNGTWLASSMEPGSFKLLVQEV